MNESTKEFIHELATKRTWSFVNEIIYKLNPTTKNIVSVKCCFIEPELKFDAREYLNINELEKILYEKYSKIFQDTPYSTEDIMEYEKKHNIKLPDLARIFLTKISKSFLDITKSIHYADINCHDDFEYGICENEEIRIYYDNDNENHKKKCNSRVIEIFHEQTSWLVMVIDGIHKGRVFNSSDSGGVITTQDEIDFFLNDEKYYNLFPFPKK